MINVPRSTPRKSRYLAHSHALCGSRSHLLPKRGSFGGADAGLLVRYPGAGNCMGNRGLEEVPYGSETKGRALAQKGGRREDQRQMRRLKSGFVVDI